MIHVFAHALAAFAALVAPFWSRLKYRAAQRRIDAGGPDPRLALYRRVLFTQALMTTGVLGFWLASGVPAARFGLRPPHSWTISTVVIGLVLVLFGWSTIGLRRRAPTLREKLRERGGALLPESARELRWFAAISLGSGVAEELLYRGFLFDYLFTLLPSLGTGGMILVTSAVFGGAHLYQGWRGIVMARSPGCCWGHFTS
ncbi:MAG: CPBP family intramembrane glutamic endopeptidase [Vicinamibacterales bacterium]